MSDKSEEPQLLRRFTLLITVLLLVVFVLYPLSSGPVLLLHTRGILPDSVGTLYDPLLWCCNRTGTAGIFNRYLQWWVKITNTQVALIK